MATKKKLKTITLPLKDIKAYRVVELLCFHNVTFQGRKFTVWLQPEGGIEEIELEEGDKK